MAEQRQSEKERQEQEAKEREAQEAKEAKERETQERQQRQQRETQERDERGASQERETAARAQTEGKDANQAKDRETAEGQSAQGRRAERPGAHLRGVVGQVGERGQQQDPEEAKRQQREQAEERGASKELIAAADQLGISPLVLMNQLPELQARTIATALSQEEGGVTPYATALPGNTLQSVYTALSASEAARVASLSDAVIGAELATAKLLVMKSMVRNGGFVRFQFTDAIDTYRYDLTNITLPTVLVDDKITVGQQFASAF